MRNILKKPWFAGVLAVVACGFVVQSLLPERRFSPAPVVVSAAAPEVEAANPEANDTPPVSVADALKALSIGPTTRDPFAPRVKARPGPLMADKPEPDIVEIVRLSALWSQGGETLALLNGRIAKVGDEIGRLTIESATQDGVWLTHWKGRDFLALGAEFTLTTPAKGPPPVTLAAASS